MNYIFHFYLFSDVFILLFVIFFVFIVILIVVLQNYFSKLVLYHSNIYIYIYPNIYIYIAKVNFLFNSVRFW